MTEPLTCPYCASVDTSYKKKAEQWECNDCEKRFDAPNVAKHRPQRIFLSYGHDENTALVLELRQRLEAAGHNVWTPVFVWMRSELPWRIATVLSQPCL